VEFVRVEKKKKKKCSRKWILYQNKKEICRRKVNRDTQRKPAGSKALVQPFPYTFHFSPNCP